MVPKPQFEASAEILAEQRFRLNLLLVGDLCQRGDQPIRSRRVTQQCGRGDKQICSAATLEQQNST